MLISGNTDTGLVRATNQDTFASGVFPNGAVWIVVCDGMGGVNGGQIASTTATDTIQKRFELAYNPNMDARSIRNMLLCACEAANYAVHSKTRDDRSLVGMGTTVVSMIIFDRVAYILHVGDSRVYYLDDDGLHQVTRDHSIVQELVESGEISAEEAQTHPQKNIITKALGVNDTLSYDYNEIELSSGSRILACTDGLTNMLAEQEIEEILKDNNNTEDLIQAAKDKGGTDNITAVLVYDIS